MGQETRWVSVSIHCVSFDIYSCDSEFQRQSINASKGPCYPSSSNTGNLRNHPTSFLRLPHTEYVCSCMIQSPVLLKHVWRSRDRQFAINMYAGVVDLFIHVDLRVEWDAPNNGFEGEVDGGAAPDEGCGAGGKDEGKHYGGIFLAV